MSDYTCPACGGRQRRVQESRGVPPTIMWRCIDCGLLHIRRYEQSAWARAVEALIEDAQARRDGRDGFRETANVLAEGATDDEA